MAKGMAQIQQCPRACAFGLVSGDDARFGLHRCYDGPCANGRVTGKKAVQIVFAIYEEVGIIDQAIFDHFGKTSRQLARRYSRQQFRVDQHQCRLMKCADKVFACRAVDCGLATDAAVHLRQQGRRDLHERTAALHDMRCKTGDVADNAAA